MIFSSLVVWCSSYTTYTTSSSTIFLLRLLLLLLSFIVVIPIQPQHDRELTCLPFLLFFLLLLLVKELKTISYEIEKLLSRFCLNTQTTKVELAGLQNRFYRPASNSKKDAWVRFLQNCFYKDRLLGIVVGRDDVIWKALDIQQTGKKRKKNERSSDEGEEGVTSTNSTKSRQLDKENREERCDYEEDEEEQERNEFGLMLSARERKRRKSSALDTLVASTSFLNPSPLSSPSRDFTNRLGGDSLSNTCLRSDVVDDQTTSLAHHLRHGTGALRDDLMLLHHHVPSRSHAMSIPLPHREECHQIIANAAQQQHLSAIAYQTIPHSLSQTPNYGTVVRAPSTIVQPSNSGEVPSLAHHHRQGVLNQRKLEAVRMMNPHYSTGTAQTSVPLYPSSSSLGPNYFNPLPVEQTPGCLLPVIIIEYCTIDFSLGS
jgi:hypothetical protein